MVGRIYGTTRCGSNGFREDFLKKLFPILNQYMASIDTRIMDGRIWQNSGLSYQVSLGQSLIQMMQSESK